MESLRRLIAILDVLVHTEASLGVTEIARRVHLSKATTYRLLKTLTSHGLVREQDPGPTYGPGFRILELAGAWMDRLDVRAKALPILRDLREKSGETVSLNLLVGFQRVAVERLEAPHEIRFVVDLGRQLPLHQGATGKVLLAHLSPEEQQRILRTVEPRRRRKLAAELGEIRARGTAVSFGERIPGSASVSAPVYDHSGRVLACVSILGSAIRFTADTVRRFRSLAVEAARAISWELGYPAEERSKPAKG